MTLRALVRSKNVLLQEYPPGEKVNRSKGGESESDFSLDLIGINYPVRKVEIQTKILSTLIHICRESFEGSKAI